MPNLRLIARSVFWSATESGGAALLSLVTLIVLAKLLGPAEFGVAALALGIVQMLNLPVEDLFHDAIVQRRAIEPEHLDSAFSASLALAVLLFAAVWFGAPLAGAVFGEPTLGEVLPWAAVSLLFSAPSGVLAAKLRRDMDLRPLALRTLSGRLVAAAVGIGMAAAGCGVWSLVAQHVVATGTAASVLWWRSPQRPSMRCSPAQLRELSGFALPSLLTRVAWAVDARLFTLLFGYLLGAAALGYFNLAWRTVETGRTILATAVGQVALPVFSRRQDDLAALRRAFRSATELACLLTLPAYAGLAACAGAIVPAILGPQWEPTVPMVQILAVGALVGSLRQFVPVVLNATGRPRLSLALAVLSAATSLLALALFGAAGGVAVATLCFHARHVAAFPAGVAMIRRVLGLGFAGQFAGTAAPLAAAAAMAATLLIIRTSLLATWSAAPSLALLVPLGAGLYLTLIALVSPTPIRRVLTLLRDGFGTRLFRHRPARAAPTIEATTQRDEMILR